MFTAPQSSPSVARRDRRANPGIPARISFPEFISSDDPAVAPRILCLVRRRQLRGHVPQRTPRCGKCRENEGIIDDAKRFLGMYGLRPLGGTLQSDDDEEREYRVNAREARRVLNEIRMDVLPDAAAVRKAIRPRAATVVADTSPARASRPASTGTATRVAAPVKTDTVDIDTLQTRVLGLLDQLGSIDEQIKVAELAQGLPARARLSDLNKQKATVLRTLAALEKARIAASN